MGFNAMQPGRVKRADLVIFLAALAVVAGLIAWAIWG
jgi:hypothetical protein